MKLLVLRHVLKSTESLHLFFLSALHGMQIIVPRPEIKPVPPAAEAPVLTSGPPGMSDIMLSFKNPRRHFPGI